MFNICWEDYRKPFSCDISVCSLLFLSPTANSGMVRATAQDAQSNCQQGKKSACILMHAYDKQQSLSPTKTNEEVKSSSGFKVSENLIPRPISDAFPVTEAQKNWEVKSEVSLEFQQIKNRCS